MTARTAASLGKEISSISVRNHSDGGEIEILIIQCLEEVWFGILIALNQAKRPPLIDRKHAS